MLLVGKQLLEEKIRLYKSQDGKCPLCGLDLDPEVSKNHLDHDHSLDGENAGRVRSLLCVFCNSLDGQILHKFKSSGLNTRGVDMSVWFERWLEYTYDDYSKNRIHPKFIQDKTKQVSKMNKDDIINEMVSINCDIPVKTVKSDLIKIYKKQLRKFHIGDKICK